LSEACRFIPIGSFHLMLLTAIVRTTTRRDLVAPARGGLAQCGPYTTYDRASHWSRLRDALLRAIELGGGDQRRASGAPQ
jgi:hypothetical protein